MTLSAATSIPKSPGAPTGAGRALPAAHAPTLTAALDAVAAAETGVNVYGLRGELVEALTYGELRTRALALAGRLQAAGLERGERVGLVAESSADFVLAFFACQYAGLVPVPLPTPAPLGGRGAYADQLSRLMAAGEVAAAFGPAGLRSVVEEAGERAGVRLLTPLAELPPGTPAPAPGGPDEACYLQFSSGSTRAPAGVMVTHRALTANAHAITRHGLQVSAADRALSWLPLFHDMGMVGFLLSPLTVGMTVDLLPTDAFVRRPLLWPRLMAQTGATISYSPTFGYELCARRAETAGVTDLDLSRWRVAGVGGDMVRPGPLAAFAERFAPAGFARKAYVASYGMAEATLALCMAPLGAGLQEATLASDRLERGGDARPAQGEARTRDFVSCGPVLPGHELEVRDAAGARLPERRVGRAFVRGPSLMRGYFAQPEATRAVLSADGWLDTGDLGFLSDGAFTPTGRSKDLILLNGRNIWPQDLEWTAEAEIAGLRSGDVAAFPLPGLRSLFSTDADADAAADVGGVAVLVQTRVRDPVARERLAGEVATLLRARHGVEAQVELVGHNALPQTSSGKLRRAQARALHLAGAFSEPA